MIKLENINSEDFNFKVPNELSSIQVNRINRLLQETIDTYPTDINNNKLKSKKFNEILNKYGKTIYFCLKPFEIQKSKLYQCIERLNKIITITQNQKSNFYEKLEKIENSEKKCLIEMLIENQQNQNADRIQLTKSNSSLMEGSQRVVDISGKDYGIKIDDLSTSMKRSPTVSILKNRNLDEINKVKCKNVINQKIIERGSICQSTGNTNSLISGFPSRKDETTFSNNFDLNKRDNIIAKREYYNAEKISFNKKDSGVNFESNKSFSSQRSSPRINFVQSRIQDKKYQSDDKQSKILSKAPSRGIRALSLNIENSLLQTNTFPKNFDKQDTECSSSVSSEIKTSKIIISKNENIVTNFKFDTKSKFDENSKISKINEFEDEDLIQKILSKFDSVKQFIEKYRKQQKRQVSMNNFNHNNDSKQNVKCQYVTEWISANKNVENQILNLQLKKSKNSSSISQLCRSVSPRPFSDKANKLKQIEEASINIIVDVDKD